MSEGVVAEDCAIIRVAASIALKITVKLPGNVRNNL
jgi:hypothetical protein